MYHKLKKDERYSSYNFSNLLTRHTTSCRTSSRNETGKAQDFVLFFYKNETEPQGKNNHQP